MTDLLTKYGTVFVTVGTTEFDRLVKIIASHEALSIFSAKGFTKVLIQIGKGEIPELHKMPSIEVEFYRHKDSTFDDIASAALVISHAGSGSILDALEQEKPLVAVVNPHLMGNHQTELAKHLHSLGHLTYCTTDTVLDTLCCLDISAYTPLPKGEPQKLGQYLDRVMGFK